MSDFDDIDSEDFLIIEQGRWRSTFDIADVFFFVSSFIDKRKTLCYNLLTLRGLRKYLHAHLLIDISFATGQKGVIS